MPLMNSTLKASCGHATNPVNHVTKSAKIQKTFCIAKNIIQMLLNLACQMINFVYLIDVLQMIMEQTFWIWILLRQVWELPRLPGLSS
jgi:hypothetical protein